MRKYYIQVVSIRTVGFSRRHVLRMCGSEHSEVCVTLHLETLTFGKTICRADLSFFGLSGIRIQSAANDFSRGSVEYTLEVTLLTGGKQLLLLAFTPSLAGLLENSLGWAL